MDTDGSGRLSLEEFREATEVMLGPAHTDAADDVERLFYEMDEGGTGDVSVGEFSAFFEQLLDNNEERRGSKVQTRLLLLFTLMLCTIP